jgi:argininosuccinate synthase
MNNPEVVLAFSGGLDTSFCVPYLREQGYDVVTLFVDTGGVDDEERDYIEQRALALGAVEHIRVDAGSAIYDEVVVPLIWGGVFYQEQYPLLCSDRYLIVKEALEVCRARGTKRFAHGCTGMGNDQVRFDLTVRALGDFEILAPIREIQQEHTQVRDYERAYLEERGFDVRAKASRYTVNENLLGVTTSGSEIDSFAEPGPETYQLCRDRKEWPATPLRLTLDFDHGKATAIDGQKMAGPELLGTLNRRLGAYGVGRGIYTGDTTIGLKGHIVFEAPGLTGLQVAHRALEESVFTRHQNQFKHRIARQWVELVYQGFFYEPLKDDLEAYLSSSQRLVNGSVQLMTQGGNVHAVAIESKNILHAKGATYAQSADWGVSEAEGFIKLFGQSSSLWAEIHRPDRGPA